MPLDPTFVPALERELEYAMQVSPGGQPPNESRIAAIKEQIALHSSAAPKTEEAGDASNESTDYRSHDDGDKIDDSGDAEARDNAVADAPEDNAAVTPDEDASASDDFETA